MLPLFDEEPTGFDRRGLADKLAKLRQENIWIGTSSWKYDGWFNQIYSRSRYQTRGRFSQKRFEQECLNEYAEVFPIVCGDFSFYQFPAETFWQKLFSSAPRDLNFAFKVPEEITAKVFPLHARYGPKAGLANEAFLNADMFEIGFAKPLLPYRERIRTLIFEFGSFSRKTMAGGGDEFMSALDPFLGRLTPEFRYAIEIRNPEFLGSEYFGLLRRHRVAHVFNAWTRMPEIGVQTALPESRTADFTVVRALLRQGRAYEEAVERFSPYDRVQDENPGTRKAIRDVISKAREKKEPSYIFVNNRLEGNAPKTIEAVITDP